MCACGCMCVSERGRENVCVLVSGHMLVRETMCVIVSVSERDRMCVLVGVHVSERGREKVCVLVSVHN